ncbi:tRNA (adenosine(37)-N6)-threonylcarbamoyltransferase complex ATPase subunit type 1 TsaE [bacterium]|jgi:tRNA threonylcarbamoyladenosine biosynthesis protein TsaE|nr:tRNA (adenosine(37)-N6)-threonylcarbamoyltransferase complex ATPase subunit type 1 TsaE [bacterium]
MKQKLVYSLEELDLAASLIVHKMQKYKIFALSGSLGAGKTTLVQAALKRCGVLESITSPTFTYVNIYNNKSAETFYHFDLYRLSSYREFAEAGFEEYLDVENSWSFIEWPEVIKDFLSKEGACFAKIDYHGFDKRVLEICK